MPALLLTPSPTNYEEHGLSLSLRALLAFLLLLLLLLFVLLECGFGTIREVEATRERRTRILIPPCPFLLVVFTNVLPSLFVGTRHAGRMIISPLPSPPFCFFFLSLSFYSSTFPLSIKDSGVSLNPRVYLSPFFFFRPLSESFEVVCIVRTLFSVFSVLFFSFLLLLPSRSLPGPTHHHHRDLPYAFCISKTQTVRPSRQLSPSMNGSLSVQSEDQDQDEFMS